MVREAVPHVSELSLLDVLLDRVELLVLGDLDPTLEEERSTGIEALPTSSDELRRPAHLQLGIGPSRNLHDHVQDSLLIGRVERDVVPGRYRHPISLKVDPVLQRVGMTNCPGAVRRRHLGRQTRRDRREMA